MRKCIVSGFVAAGVSAAIIVPLTYGALGQETPTESNVATIGQSADRADARIAILKADLLLSSEQARHWSGLVFRAARHRGETCQELGGVPRSANRASLQQFSPISVAGIIHCDVSRGGRPGATLKTVLTSQRRAKRPAWPIWRVVAATEDILDVYQRRHDKPIPRPDRFLCRIGF